MCREHKPLTDFNKRALSKDGLQTVCRECNRARSRKYYADNPVKHKKAVMDRNRKAKEKLRAIVIAAKNVPCLDCKRSYPSYVMDFDHVRGNKVADISLLVQKICTQKVLLEEIAKCEVVCANCHRERTFNRDGWNPDPDLA